VTGGPRDHAVGPIPTPSSSVPAMTGPDDQVERCRYGGGSLHTRIRDAHVRAHRQFHRIPAARERAIDARIATAQVRRVSLSFTLVHLDTDTGPEPATGLPRRSAEPPRSLALRPRLTAGLPWTDDPRKAGLAFVPDRRCRRGFPPRPVGSHGGVLSREVPVRTGRAPSHRRPGRTVGAQVGRSQSPARRPAPTARALSFG
jgi:hypothetical protein